MDTGYIYSVALAGTSCPEINYPLALTNLIGVPSFTDVSLLLPSLPINPVIVENSTFLTMEYTVVSGDVITIYHNDALCSSQGAWEVKVVCLN